MAGCDQYGSGYLTQAAAEYVSDRHVCTLASTL
jgi:hypothetical protein